MILEVDKKVDWLLNKRIKALIRAKRKAKDKEFKMLWEIKLIELLRNHRNKLSIH
tara:strand:+ start:1553 stop:1717 length:165 start_codon:yes stop_codon:yes gene_type:complete